MCASRCWLVFFCLLARLALAASDPLLQIEAGRHAAFVHALVADPAHGEFWSASEDKTLRRWRLSDGRLLDTLRVPARAGAQGQLYALALSPDGHTLATGGWTCWDIEHRACIYLVDRATGALLGRLPDLEEVVASLKFSPDGRFLAVGLMGREGLRVFRLQDRRLVFSDRDYRDKLLELDFTPQGQLLTASLDGFVRLYGADFTLLGRSVAGLAGREPFGLSISPSGAEVAIGFNDAPRVTILRADTLAVQRQLIPPAVDRFRQLTRVAWSGDGRTFFATGESSVGSESVIARWRMADGRSLPSLVTATGRIGALVSISAQQLLLGSEQGVLAILSDDGQPRWRLEGAVDNFDARTELRLTADGTGVGVRRPGNNSGWRFDVAHLLLTTQSAQEPALRAAVTRQSNLTVTFSAESLSVNGRALALEPLERVHSYAIDVAGRQVVAGTEWALHALSVEGQKRWAVRTSTTVRQVNVSADGRWVVALLADGTVRWFAASSGAEVLSLFVSRRLTQWVAWTPSGRYASSPLGDELVGWQWAHGFDTWPDYFRAVQFENDLYQPADVTRALRADSAAAKSRSLPGLLATLPLPPRLTLVASGNAKLLLTASSSGLPMLAMTVYINDIPQTRTVERALSGRDQQTLVRELPLPLGRSDRTIRVEISNGRSLGLVERLITEPAAAADNIEPGDLYVFAVGVNHFTQLDPGVALSYAARDAEEVAAMLRRWGARRFRQVHVQTLSDLGTLPTQAAIRSILARLADVRGNDTVMVFLASHGISDDAGNYYFVPRDARSVDVDAVLAGKVVDDSASLLGWAVIFERLRQTAGRRFLIVDTCQARNVVGRFDPRSLVKRSASSRIGFMLASRGDEESQEYARSRHGLFTLGLLQGLQPANDRNRDGRVNVREWFEAAASTVERLRDRSIGPQTPQFEAPESLAALPLLESAP